MFDNYEFRASSLPTLMTKSKKKGVLSQTTKSVLNEIYLDEIYGRKKIISSKYIEKGIERENESIALYRKTSQVFVEKNDQEFHNGILKGTPDILHNDFVVDIKTNWDIFTFFSVDAKKAETDYFYQLVAYMILTQRKKAKLAYCLISNDEFTLFQEFQKIKYNKGYDDDDPMLVDIEDQIRTNHTYDDIDIKKRIKIFEFALDDDLEIQVNEQLEACRSYLNNLYESSKKNNVL